MSGWVKHLTGVPTIAVGGVGLAQTGIRSSAAASLDALVAPLARGEIDLLAVGRAVLADPEWPRMLRAGRAAEGQDRQGDWKSCSSGVIATAAIPRRRTTDDTMEKGGRPFLCRVEQTQAPQVGALDQPVLALGEGILHHNHRVRGRQEVAFAAGAEGAEHVVDRGRVRLDPGGNRRAVRCPHR